MPHRAGSGKMAGQFLGVFGVTIAFVQYLFFINALWRMSAAALDLSFCCKIRMVSLFHEYAGALRALVAARRGPAAYGGAHRALAAARRGPAAPRAMMHFSSVWSDITLVALCIWSAGWTLTGRFFFCMRSTQSIPS